MNVDILAKHLKKQLQGSGLFRPDHWWLSKAKSLAEAYEADVNEGVCADTISPEGPDETR